MNNKIYEQMKTEYLYQVRDSQLSRGDRTPIMRDFVMKYHHYKEELRKLSHFLDEDHCLGCFLLGTQYHDKSYYCHKNDCQTCIEVGGSIDFIINNFNKPLT